MVSFIKVVGRIVTGLFQERLNRFLAHVRVEDRILPCFVPNPGRMYELLTLGTEVLLKEVFKENRKTNHDLIGVFHDDLVVSIDSRVSNKLVFDALKNRDIQEFTEYDSIKPEYNYEHSRLDFFSQ